MRAQSRLQLDQFLLRVAELAMERQLDADFVQLVADPLQARLAVDQRVLGIVDAKLRLEAVKVGDQVELDVAQERKHQ